MSWNYQQQAFDSQPPLGNVEQWREQTESLDSNTGLPQYTHGYNTPQTANMEFDICVEVKPPEPIPYDNYARESSQSDPLYKNNGGDTLPNAEPFIPYRPPGQQVPLPPTYGNDAPDDVDLDVHGHFQGRGYQIDTAQLPDADPLQQQHYRFNSTEAHGTGLQPYAPYQPFGSDENLGYGMERTQHPPPPPQNIGFGTLEQNNGSSIVHKEYENEFGFDNRPNSLPGYDRVDAPNLEADIRFRPALQSDEPQSSELRSIPTPITEQDHSASAYRSPTASGKSLQMQDPMPSTQQHDRTLDLGSRRELNSDASMSQPHLSDHGLAQPSAEQRARWELIRSLVKGSDHSENEEHHETKANRKSRNMSPKDNQNQSQQGPAPAPSPSKGMRTLMLPQMVERRKSMDASGEGKHFSATSKQGQAETSGHQSPPQSAPSDLQNFPQSQRSPQTQGRQQPSASNGALPNKPAVPLSEVAPGAAAHAMIAPRSQSGGQGPKSPVPQKHSSNPLQQPLPTKITGTPGSGTHSTINARPYAARSITKSSSTPDNATPQPIRAPGGASVSAMPTPSSMQNASQARPGERAAPVPSQPRKPLPSATRSSFPMKAPPQRQAPPHLPESQSAPKSSSFNPIADAKQVAVAPTPTSRPQAQAAALSSKPLQTPTTKLAASNKSTIMRPGASPASSPHPSLASKSPQQKAKSPASNNRAIPTGTSIPTPQTPMQAGEPKRSPLTTPSTSQSKPVSPGSKPLPTPQQAVPPQRSVPQRRPSVQTSSTSQQPSSQRPIPTNQPVATTIARRPPPNPTATESEQPPSRSKGSLGRSGAVFRRTTPQQVTGAPEALGSASTPHQDPMRSRQPSTARSHPSLSHKRQERPQDSTAESHHDRNDDDDSSDEGRETDLSSALPSMLDQLAASEEADLESEASNLVHRESRPPPEPGTQ